MAASTEPPPAACGAPCLKELTAPDYGRPPAAQRRALQELVKAHVESFDYVLHEGLSQAVQAIPPIEFMVNGNRLSLAFADTSISPPMVGKAAVCRDMRVFPAECRARRATYRGKLMADVSWSVNGEPQGIIQQSLGQVPIMVKSKTCNLRGMSPAELIAHHEEAEEMGGYYIINGIEKVVRMLIMPRRNYPIALNRPKWKSRGPGYTEFGLSIHCVCEEHTAINMNLHYLDNGTVMLNFIYRKQLFFMPLGFALKGLVSFTDYRIFSELTKGMEGNSFYRSCVAYMMRSVGDEGCLTQAQVMRYLGERFRVKLLLPEWLTDEEVAEFLFDQCICIHLKNNVEKFQLLCMMTRKLFAFAKGECAPENPDSLSTQEVLTSGHLYLMMLKEKMEGWLMGAKFSFDKRVQRHGNIPLTMDSIAKVLTSVSDLTRATEYLLATGNLASKTGLGMLQDSGLAVVADKLNFTRYISHFRAVHRGAAFARMRTTTVRRLLPESWGFLCPVHTPDGTPCGLLNHLTVGAQVVTAVMPTGGLPALLCSLGVVPVDGTPACPYSECYPVMLDGSFVGWADPRIAPEIVSTLRTYKARKEKRVPPWTEVVLVPKTTCASLYPALYVFTGAGRLIRPVRNLALGTEELIGTFEQIYMDIAIRENEIVKGVTTHQELFPHSMLSVVANFIPYSDHNQSPRNMYQCQMGKQTMGTPLHNFRDRSDNKLYRLQTPQSPLVRPYMYDHYAMDTYPAGTNAVVAVISYTGYDMEDAMIVNKSSWERGFAHGSIYKTELVDLTKCVREGRDELVFGFKAGDDARPGAARLDADGLPSIGSWLRYGEPFYSYVNLATGEATVIAYKGKEDAVVDNVKACGNDSGTGRFYRACITMRIPRNPTIGDKFASRHGQKGILSRLWRTEDMPFSEGGMTPDILFNPHGFPSRMTIGMLIESMAGKSAAMHGLCHDATPFTFSERSSTDGDEGKKLTAVEYFGKLLSAAGYSHLGTERLYSGISGLELDADIFIGIVYYQRLRHMVSDKFQVRTTGARDRLTCQPVGGRNVQGGVRFGEMERDALLAHGTSFLLHDRLVACSDRCEARVCTRCGSLLSPTLERPPPDWAHTRSGRRAWACVVCKSADDVCVVTMPFVLRYFVAELASMNIKVKLQAGPGVQMAG
ncbi:DNA-directed RNA polymerase I subunit RPA2 [Petromyzon marinus]|uniref:DNA-directed RNA polymerase I subunit RPA2 n=1 Tax=Petromyzon marinus TaxID=7757 RepID=UPI003F706DFC